MAAHDGLAQRLVSVQQGWVVYSCPLTANPFRYLACLWDAVLGT